MGDKAAIGNGFFMSAHGGAVSCLICIKKKHVIVGDSPPTECPVCRLKPFWMRQQLSLQS